MPAYSMYSPTETTAPVAGTTAGLWTFTNPVGTVSVNNNTAQPAFVNINTTTGPTATSFDFVVPSGERLLLEREELGVSVSTVGAWLLGGVTVTNFVVRGI